MWANNLNALPDLSENDIIPELSSAKNGILKQTSESNASLSSSIETHQLKESILPDLDDSWDWKEGDSENSLFWNHFTEFDKMKSDELLSQILDTKILLDINSPKEWDKWIKENESTLPGNFKETFSTNFPDLYTDIDASILSSFWDINSQIKNKAIEINNQENWPYSIDFNDLSDDILIDYPFSHLSVYEWIDIWNNMETNPLKGKRTFETKEEALKQLAELQKAIMEASDWIEDIVLQYIESLWEWIMEIIEDISNLEWWWIEEWWELWKDLFIGYLIIRLNLMWISIFGSIFRILNTFIIRKTSGKFGFWEFLNPSRYTNNAAAAIEAGELNRRDEVIKNLEIEFKWDWKKWAEIQRLKKKYRTVLDHNIDKSSEQGKLLIEINDKITELNSEIEKNEWTKAHIKDLKNNLKDYKKARKVLVRKISFRFLEGTFDYQVSLIRWERTLLKSIFNKPFLLSTETENKAEIEKNIKLKENIKNEFFNESWEKEIFLNNLEKYIELSHNIWNELEWDSTDIFKDYIKKINNNEYILPKWISEKNYKELMKKKIISDLKNQWLSIENNFQDKVKGLGDVINYIWENKNLDNKIKSDFNGIWDNELLQMKAFYNEVHRKNNKYDIKTASDIASRILRWQTMDEAINNSFSIKASIIEQIEIKSNDFAMTVNDLNKNNFIETNEWNKKTKKEIKIIAEKKPSLLHPIKRYKFKKDKKKSIEENKKSEEAKYKTRINKIKKSDNVNKLSEKDGKVEITFKWTDDDSKNVTRKIIIDSDKVWGKWWVIEKMITSDNLLLSDSSTEIVELSKLWDSIIIEKTKRWFLSVKPKISISRPLRKATEFNKKRIENKNKKIENFNERIDSTKDIEELKEIKVHFDFEVNTIFNFSNYKETLKEVRNNFKLKEIEFVKIKLEQFIVNNKIDNKTDIERLNELKSKYNNILTDKNNWQIYYSVDEIENDFIETIDNKIMVIQQKISDINSRINNISNPRVNSLNMVSKIENDFKEYMKRDENKNLKSQPDIENLTAEFNKAIWEKESEIKAIEKINSEFKEKQEKIVQQIDNITGTDRAIPNNIERKLREILVEIEKIEWSNKVEQLKDIEVDILKAFKYKTFEIGSILDIGEHTKKVKNLDSYWGRVMNNLSNLRIAR